MTKPVVVLIEDDPVARRLLRTILLSQGYRLFEAATGVNGLAEAASRRPDVVVVDLGLPDMDGIEVIRRLREWTSVPVVVGDGAAPALRQVLNEHGPVIAPRQS